MQTVTDQVPLVAVIQMTELMRERMISSPTRIHKPAFAIPDVVTAPWHQRLRHLGIFVGATVPANEHAIVGLAIVIPGKREGDFERRITLEGFTAIPRPLALDRIRQRLGSRYAGAISHGPVGEPFSSRLIAAIRAEDPSLSELLDRLIARVTASMPEGHAGDIRSQEKDAINGLIRAFAGDTSLLRDAGVVSPDRPYIMALPDENQLIEHDATRFRDWLGANTPVHGTRVFEHDNRKLVVSNVNNGPVEHITGVDLIYFNQHHGCFVLVQYKNFKAEGGDLVVRPDDRLLSQLDRMREIDGKCAAGDGPEDLRLYPRPCFLKLCEPGSVRADSIDMIKGIYLPREHFEVVLNSEDARGPRGGRRIGTATPPRHLSNDTFTTLLGHGWIGSSGTGTKYVRTQVWQSLRDRGSVVVGAHLGDQGLGNGYH
jgi:hypothetical protein